MSGHELVVIGSSWGGLHALRELLDRLPAAFAAPVAIVQHREEKPSELLTELLARRSRMPVRDAQDKDELRAGCAYVAPAGYHLLIEGPDRLALSTEDPVRFSRPSVDVLFESASDVFGPAVVAVVLTGANDDGAAGLERVARRGGRAIVQDPDEAERPEMPRAALARVPQATVLGLAGIGACLTELVGTRAETGA